MRLTRVVSIRTWPKLESSFYTFTMAKTTATELPVAHKERPQQLLRGVANDPSVFGHADNEEIRPIMSGSYEDAVYFISIRDCGFDGEPSVFCQLASPRLQGGVPGLHFVSPPNIGSSQG